MSSAKTARAVPRSRWFALVWVIPAVIVACAIVVLIANGLRSLPAVQSFLITYPGDSALPSWAPRGFPAWLNWLHFLNVFFLVLIVRSGWQVRTVKRPAAFWTRNNSGLIRTKKAPKRISLDLWFHLSLDGLWVVCGIVFYVLLFTSGQWVRIVPTRWDVFPNAISTAIQYASLHWPVSNGWANYNALQLLSYFAVVFLAAPLAIVTGLRMTAAWPRDAKRLNRIYPIEWARAIHFPTMLFFVLFVIVHVTLVLATGALRNLNHMYADNNSGSWAGFWIFVVSLVVIAAAWIAARPILLRPLASLTGRLGR